MKTQKLNFQLQIREYNTQKLHYIITAISNICDIIDWEVLLDTIIILVNIETEELIPIIKEEVYIANGEECIFSELTIG